jgi:Skp family chaperone for outer membrane proteins
MKLERDLAAERAKLIQEILIKKAGPVIQEVAQREGFDIVIDSSAVLWGQPAHDLTDKVNARLK